MGYAEECERWAGEGFSGSEASDIASSGVRPEVGEPETVELNTCGACGAPLPQDSELDVCAECDAKWQAKQSEYQPIGIAAVLDQIMERFKKKL